MERDYMYDEYAHDKGMRLNLGIRRRLAPLLDNDRRRIELMNGLLMSLPGTPVIYYGDEIGMGDNIYLGDRNGVRTPMQWDGGWNAGFSSADPESLYSAPIPEPGVRLSGRQCRQSQSRSQHSLLSWMRRIIQVRKSTPIFGRGSMEFLYPENHRVLAFVRQLADETILAVNNLSASAQAVELDLSRFKGNILVEMSGRNIFPRVGECAVLADPGAVSVLLVPLAPDLRCFQPHPLTVNGSTCAIRVWYGGFSQNLAGGCCWPTKTSCRMICSANSSALAKLTSLSACTLTTTPRPSATSCRSFAKACSSTFRASGSPS